MLGLRRTNSMLDGVVDPDGLRRTQPHGAPASDFTYLSESAFVFVCRGSRMSGDPCNYYPSPRSDDRELPPLREVVGDALSRSPVSPYSFDFEDVNRALPGSSKSYGRYPGPAGYYPQRGPTLAPIRNFPLSPGNSSSRHRRSATPEVPPREPRRGPPESASPHPSPTNLRPLTGSLPYSFNVLRAQQGDLVDVRTPSSRAQGILRPTALIDDEDDSHKRYKCDWPGCEKKYDRPSSLEVHRHTHTGSQPYPCPYPGCQRAFNVKSNMLRHYRSHPKPMTSQPSGTHEEQDSDSDREDKETWPPESGERHFHRPSSFRRPLSPSSSATHSSTKKTDGSATPTSSTQYYSPSRHR